MKKMNDWKREKIEGFKFSFLDISLRSLLES